MNRTTAINMRTIKYSRRCFIAACGLRTAEPREQPMAKRVRRLDADNQRYRGDRQVVEIACGQPYRVLFGRQHDGRSSGARRRANARDVAGAERVVVAEFHDTRDL